MLLGFMAEVSTGSVPHALSYEPVSVGRDWVLISSRIIHLAGFIAWLGAGVGFYSLRHDLSDSPGPLWFDSAAGAVVGGIASSPIFGIAMLVRRFGRHMAGSLQRTG
jgi:hypothetical protein